MRAYWLGLATGIGVMVLVGFALYFFLLWSALHSG
jgi:hypothetical protein